MTYTALMSLAILRDDFTKLDRTGILQFVRSCQRDDGRHVLFPHISVYANADLPFQLLGPAEWRGIRFAYHILRLCHLQPP